MPSLTPLFAFLFILPSVSLAAGQTCYGLDGTKLDDTYGPCNPDARFSGCCAIHRPAGSVDICLDNGLCMATNGQYMGTVWQDGCTDPTGQDPACPKLCPDATNGSNGLNPVLAWNIQMCDYGSYCCRAVNDHNNCCNNATAPKVQTTFIGAFQFQTSTAGVPSATSTPTSVAATAISNGQDLSQSPYKDRGAAIGGAVGATLGAVILGLLGIILWMYKKEKRQRKLKEHYEAQFGQNWAYRRTIVLEADSTPVSAPMTPSEKGTEVIENYRVVTAEPGV